MRRRGRPDRCNPARISRPKRACPCARTRARVRARLSSCRWRIAALKSRGRAPGLRSSPCSPPICALPGGSGAIGRLEMSQDSPDLDSQNLDTPDLERPTHPLRYGWTTGACATAATRAAYEALFTGEFPDPVTITLPGGQQPAFALAKTELGDGFATAAIVKEAGDDPD